MQGEHKRRKISPSREASEREVIFKHMMFDLSLKGDDMNKKDGRGNQAEEMDEVMHGHIHQHCIIRKVSWNITKKTGKKGDPGEVSRQHTLKRYQKELYVNL